MEKIIKIDIPGHRPILADFLWADAPETCRAFIDAMPYTGLELGHAKWSGCVISFFTDMNFRKPENSRGHGVWPGDILYNPHVHDQAYHPNEVSIVYGPAAMRTFSGYAVANLFARVRPEYLEELSELGNDINLHGIRTIAVSAIDQDELQGGNHSGDTEN